MTERLGARGFLAVLALLLLVYSGFFKGSPLLAGFPVDLTLTGVALTVIGLIAAVLPHPSRLRPAWPFVGLVAVFLIGVWDALPGYGNLKVAQFYGITEFVGFGVIVLLNTHARRRAWVRAQIALAVLLSISALLSPRDSLGYVSGQAALVISGSNTISTGRAAGVAVVGLLILALLGRGRLRLACLILGGGATVPLFYAGSRGPVAAAVLAVALVVLFAPNGARRRTAQFTLVAVAVAAGVYLLRGDNTGGTGRVSSTLLAGQFTDTSSSARFILWRDALNYIPSHPLGGGWGAFSVPQEGFELLGYGQLDYPHNLLLEITGEAGWLAGLAFIAFVFGSLRRLRRSASDPHVAVLFGIAVFALINALVSSDLSDRLVWASIAAGWAVPLAPKAVPEKRRTSRPAPTPTPPAVLHRRVPPLSVPAERIDSPDWDSALGLLPRRTG